MGLKTPEKKILDTLYAQRVWLSTHQIAKITELSWETVDSYLQDLLADEMVLHQAIGNKDLWQFNYKKQAELRKKKPED